MHKLCSTCQTLFRGRWIRRPESQRYILGHETVFDDESTNDSIEDLFYEQPDWMKVSEDPSKRCEPAFHHSIPALRISAGQGCHLCNIIADKIPKDYDSLESPTPELFHLLKENSSRLVGIAVARPYAEDDTGQEGFSLELSYWLDGDCDKVQAYFLTVDLELRKIVVDSFPQEYVPVDLDTPVRLATLERIEAWVSNCMTRHELCRAKVQHLNALNDSFRHPTRFLELAALQDSQYSLRLCPSHNLGGGTMYVTLSHCWGKSPSLRLLESNYEQYSFSVSILNLPRIFREAVEFTIRLGLRYLWIDALCIIQDSEKDWLHESSLMASVYSNSYVNLAATASSDGTGGLFVADNPYLANPCIIKADWTGHPPGTYMCLDDNAWSRNVSAAVLNQRAWVLQERLLAPRTVHFALDQVWWECYEVRACESFPNGTPEAQVPIKTDLVSTFQRITSFDPESSFNAWCSIVQAYSACRLTNKKDKLIALAGVARAVQASLQVSEQDYLAGLWRENIVVDLLWRLAGPGTRTVEKVAPSWSWASVDGEVHWNSSGLRARYPDQVSLELLDVQVDVARSSTFGLLKGGHILLAAYLYPVVLCESDTTTNPDDPFMSKMLINKVEFEQGDTFIEALDHDTLYYHCPTEGIAAFFCHFATSSQPELGDQYVSEGLLLEREPTQKGTYRRIGLLRLFHEDTQKAIQQRISGPELADDQYLQLDARGRYSFGEPLQGQLKASPARSAHVATPLKVNSRDPPREGVLKALFSELL